MTLHLVSVVGDATYCGLDELPQHDRLTVSLSRLTDPWTAPAYCGNHPDRSHVDCPSSVECAHAADLDPCEDCLIAARMDEVDEAAGETFAQLTQREARQSSPLGLSCPWPSGIHHYGPSGRCTRCGHDPELVITPRRGTDLDRNARELALRERELAALERIAAAVESIALGR
jgi:hypothetical protein